MTSDKACLRGIEGPEGLNIQDVSINEKVDFPKVFPQERDEHRRRTPNPGLSVYHINVYLHAHICWSPAHPYFVEVS